MSVRCRLRPRIRVVSDAATGVWLVSGAVVFRKESVWIAPVSISVDQWKQAPSFGVGRDVCPMLAIREAVEWTGFLSRRWLR